MQAFSSKIQYSDEHRVLFSLCGALFFSFFTYFIVTGVLPHDLSNGQVAGYLFIGLYTFVQSFVFGYHSGPFLYHFFDFLNMKNKVNRDFRVFSYEFFRCNYFVSVFISSFFLAKVVSNELTFLSVLIYALVQILIFAFFNKTEVLFVNFFSSLISPKSKVKKSQLSSESKQSNTTDKGVDLDLSSISNEILQLSKNHSLFEEPFLSGFIMNVTYVNHNINLLDFEEKHKFSILVTEDVPNLISDYNKLKASEKDKLYSVVLEKFKQINTYHLSLVDKIDTIKRSSLMRSVQVIDGRFED